MRTLIPIRTLSIPLLATLFLVAQGCASHHSIQSKEYKGYTGEVNRHSRLIRAGAQKVFESLISESAFRIFCPEGNVVQHETSPPYGVGTLVKTRIEHIFLLEWHGRVEEMIPGRMIRLRFPDGFFEGALRTETPTPHS